MAKNSETEALETRKIVEEDEESEEEEETVEDWGDWRDEEDEEEEDEESGFLCLFCDAKYSSCDAIFDHCRLSHHFDFHSIKTALGLDFYGSFKLINYVRSQKPDFVKVIYPSFDCLETRGNKKGNEIYCRNEDK